MPFYSINPENLLLVINRENIRLFDAELLAQIEESNIVLTDFSKIYLNGFCKYVQGNLPGLMNEIRKYCSQMEFPVTSG